ncbi:MAG: hypothetical protein COU31_01860 [Candidatus Magasanikbacteria bacterium CG10_big_fil_rev_8_21_14_0_10_40_10]|uniref:Phosphoenolpyruvate synthase n=1 Tax=Candidatus Magasanikbacteria bacterium CG10_big_fil_rev_8_21_14_0_10_40_10 TaxID=1974648 RepID=A0A2M6W4E7_9BACT|nr:MAG: hypothetical protein COU31_01860 [Candidatus Magasanikbacteria bacterium CG10_big_fil_rev_8_21_14_0_10_40_10]
MPTTSLTPLSQLTNQSTPQAGGKGASLGEMMSANIPVPDGFVVLASGFDEYISSSGLAGEIKARLSQVNIDDVNSIEKTSVILRDCFHDTPLPVKQADEILQAFDRLNVPLVAVRSSATAEDSNVASWAGELETFLNTDRACLTDNIKKCWSSLFTPRAIFYRHEKKMMDSAVSVAVVVQAMIQSDVSGICFTVHPVTEDKNSLIIEAGLGLGEAIVGGQITPDSYVVDKTDMSVNDINVAIQSKKLIRRLVKSSRPASLSPGFIIPPDPNQWVELSESQGGQQKMTGRQIIELAELCVKIEKRYGYPCDIEWAMANNKFYITQCRPITTLKNN